MNSTLEQLRHDWEIGGDVVLEVTHNEVFTADHYSTVYVVLNFHNGQYALHRYFSLMTGTKLERWEVSVDASNKSLEDCLAMVTSDFKKIYPKECKEEEVASCG